MTYAESFHIDDGNSTSTTLGTSGVYTGTAFDCSGFAMATFFVYSDQSSATDGFSIQFSTDGTNWDRQDAKTVTGGASKSYSYTVITKYMRVVYTNGTTAQTEFRLQTRFHKSQSKNVTSSLNKSITNDDGAELTRSVIVGATTGGTYKNVDVDPFGRFTVAIESPISTFGELRTAQASPSVQLDAVYGLLNNVDTFTNGGGTATVSGKEFLCTTGTSAGGYGVIRSKRGLRYRPGQGATARFTARFTTPVAGSWQFAGVFQTTDGAVVGYNGTNFSVLHDHGGELEIRVLTIGTAATGAETATVTLNGTAENVSVTSGTVQHNAKEIADHDFTGVGTGWNTYQNDATVVFVGRSSESRSGSYSLTNGGGGETIAGTFAQTQAGSAKTSDFTAQASFNIDTLDGTGPSGITIDPTKGNVFEISYGYLGYAGPAFSIKEPVTGIFHPFHRVRYENANTTPVFSNPTMKVGWYAVNTTNTSNLSVYGGSVYAATDGVVRPFENPRGYENSKTLTSAYTNVLTIRCRAVFGGTHNLRELSPVRLGISSAVTSGGAKTPVLWRVYYDPTVGGTTNYQYVDESYSSAEYEVSGTTVTNGTLITTAVTESDGADTIDMGALDIHIAPGSTIVIAAKTAGANIDGTAALTWNEE